jgi:lysophospholipase L1-like esterase
MIRPQFLVVLAFCSILSSEFCQAATDGLPSNARRIVFLGDSITHGGAYVDYIEAQLLTRFPDRDYEIVDIGLPSETVSGLSEPGHAGGAFPRPNLHERLDRALEKLKPDLVVACYGMNDGIYYPFSQERFAAFTNGIVRLREKVIARGGQIIHITPPVFDSAPLKGNTRSAGEFEKANAGTQKQSWPFEGYDGVLEKYSAWLIEQRKNGWIVIDVHGPMKKFLAEMRTSNPEFKLAGDGVHIDDTGHRLVAKQIALAWNLPDLNIPPPVVGLVRKRRKLLSDAWLTEIGHLRPGMARGLPISDALEQAAVLKEQIRKQFSQGQSATTK